MGAWYLLTVRFLKTNSGKKGEGMPVVRNPQFYFREGFRWSAINGTRSTNDLKFCYKSKSVNDVQGMSLCCATEAITSQYITAICNADFISKYTEGFVNSTVIFQINDCRQIPIIIPTNEELTYIIHSGFISGYQNRYGDNLKPPTNVYHRMTA